MDQIDRDLLFVFFHHKIRNSDLEHVLANRHRLSPGKYAHSNGDACLMAMLTETRTDSQQIRCKADLTAFFGREIGKPEEPGYIHARESSDYQPAKWLVRAYDGHLCEKCKERYGAEVQRLTNEKILDVCAVALELRKSAQMADSTSTDGFEIEEEESADKTFQNQSEFSSDQKAMGSFAEMAVSYMPFSGLSQPDS